MPDAFGFPLAFDPHALANAMREQFGWGEADLLKASEALMSAAQAGLRRNEPTTAALQAFMAFMPGFANQPLQPQTGFFGEPLALFFGPAPVQQAIVDMVAQQTGLDPSGIQTMMPVIATLTFGNMARQYVAGPARDLLDAFLAGYARGRPKPAPTPAEIFAPYGEAMRSFWDGYFRALGAFQSGGEQASGDEAEAAADEAGGNGVGADAAAPAPTEAACSKPQAPEASLADAWLALGRDIQEKQIRTFENLFDQTNRAG